MAEVNGEFPGLATMKATAELLAAEEKRYPSWPGQ